MNKVAINTYLSITTLSVNGLDTPFTDMAPEWVRKQGSYTCCLQESHHRVKDTH